VVVGAAIQSRRAKERKVREALGQARLCLEDGKPDEAVTLLSKTAAEVEKDTKGVQDLKMLLDQARKEVQRAADRSRLQEALTRAEQLRRDGRPAEAVKAIDEVLAAVPSDTSGRAFAEASRAKARDELEIQALEQRQRAFTGKLFSEEWRACQEFVLPEDRMKLGAGGIEIRLGLLRGIAKFIKMSPETVRVDRVELGPDRKTAEVYVSFRLPDGWKEQKPIVWQGKQGSWFLHFE